MFYIDGYNLLFKVQKNHSTLQEARELIIRDLNKRLANIKLEASIIFDSTYTEGMGSHNSLDYLHVIYTAKKETADEWIFHAIKRSKAPHTCTVVTSDKKLSENIRAQNAKVLNVETFIIWLNKRQKAKATILLQPQEVQPILKKTSSLREGSCEYYLKIFEERFKCLTEQ
jgi:predicted RNA-binding protein with PIN domain